MSRAKQALVPVKDLDQPPVILASGNEAVAGIADRLIGLSPAQRAFLRLRFYFETDADCARAVGIKPQSVRVWKMKGSFAELYRQLLTQPILHARAELALLTNKAINAIGDLLDSPNPTVRLAAAEKVLKSRDAQLLTNNVKVEGGDGDDLYTVMMARLSKAHIRITERVAETLPEPESAAPPEGETVEAQFSVLPDPS